MKIIDYKIYTKKLEDLDLNKRQIINTINPHSYVTAKEDKVFKEALLHSDELIPDGSGIVFAAKLLHQEKINKIAGYDLHEFLLKEMDKKGGKVFYMGASNETLIKLQEKIHEEYPNVQVDAYSPPFKETFSDDENEIIINKINAFTPDVLFIGMTAPKQEKWLHAHAKKLNFRIASSIGAVFDFYSGKVSRPSSFWIKLHLEWFVRFIAEPKRLWRRNLISTPKFIFDLCRYKFTNFRD